MEPPFRTRLNKHIALQLGISRREADELIAKDNVLLNGVKAELGARVTSNDTLQVNGKELDDDTPLQYVLLHKPAGYVCSRRAQGNAPTIYSLLPKNLHTLKPVGRLDKDSSGLILLSNDGDFAFHMTHPKFHKTKLYTVELDRDLEPLHQQMISDYGVQLDDGPSKFLLSRLSEKDRQHWQVTMTEGRSRQIRRTFAALGYQVTALHRTVFGNYHLNELASGAYQEVKNTDRKLTL